MSDSKPLSGRTALVTGASRGVGAAIARALASLGATIVATYRTDRDAADDLVTQLTSEYGVVAHAVPFDLTAPPEDQSGADGILDAWPGSPTKWMSSWSTPPRPTRKRHYGSFLPNSWSRR